jgi:uncharacterized damage-inducible protein DinB
VLVEACRYHRWANLHLLDACAAMSDEQLQLTAPGTYGTLAATFQHLVHAERRYLWRLEGGPGRFSQRHRFPGIEALRELAAVNGDQLVKVARRIKGADAVMSKWRIGTFRVDSGILLIQALHHGNDHRTHICTILGVHDIPYGEMDVWAYGEATGAMVRVPAKA